MKYDITWSCGHEETIELFGKNKDRERKIEYYQNCCKCEACRAKDAEKIEKPGCKAVEMFYGEYKEKYSNCETRPYSYNKETKTIVVFVPVEVDVESEEVQDFVAEAVEEIKALDEKITDGMARKILTVNIEDLRKKAYDTVWGSRKSAEQARATYKIVKDYQIKVGII